MIGGANLTWLGLIATLGGTEWTVPNLNARVLRALRTLSAFHAHPLCDEHLAVRKLVRDTPNALRSY